MIDYSYYVSAHASGVLTTLYNGKDAADAMAAWSEAITAGVEYVFLEALKDIPK